jgi:hypothetical protein
MKIVIEREVAKYKGFVSQFYWRILRPLCKYRELTEDQAKIAEELREAWFNLKDEWNIQEDE